MEHQKIINTAIESIPYHPGIKARWKPNGVKELDGELELFFNREHFKLNIEVRKQLRNHQLPAIFQLAEKYPPLIVIAEHIFPLLKEQLRAKNIGYLEANGNIFFGQDNTFLWIDGQKPIETIKKKGGLAFTKAGLKVVFQLLLNDEHINLPYRELAAKAQVALGNINNVMTGLKEMGYILHVDVKKKKLQRQKELLDRWMAGYGEILKPALYAGTFKFINPDNFKNWRNIRMGNNMLWGGEPAGDLLTNNLHPEVLTIYATANKAELMKHLRIAPDKNGNIRVYEKFWTDPVQDGTKQPPALLTYADLMLTGDPRCQEIADQLFKQEGLYEKFA